MFKNKLKEEKTCRACTKTEQNELVSLFDKQILPEGLSYSDMITECTMYPILKNDNLPHVICYDCSDKVRVAYEFKKQYAESQTKLLELLELQKLIPIEPIETIFYNSNDQLIEQEDPINTTESIQRTTRNSNISKVSDSLKELPTIVLEKSNDKKAALTCPTCFKDFTYMGYLKNHILNVHKKDPVEPDLESPEKVIVKSSCGNAEFVVQTIKSINNVTRLEGDNDDNEFDFGIDNDNNSLALLDPDIINSIKEEIDVSDTHIHIIEPKTIPATPELNEITETSIEKPKEKSTKKSKQTKNSDSQRKYECEICHKAFKRKSHLKQHKVSHTKQKQYECPICHKRFGRTDNLKVHIANHGKRKFECDLCKQLFGQSYLLRRHKEQTHSDEKPYLCSECGQRFVRNGDLICHMRRHTGEKPFKCQYCNKGFTRSTEVHVHERYHTGEKNHICNVCGKGFQRPYNLQVHMRIHTGERPYKCTHCPKTFAQCSDLKAHTRRHTGERYKCDQCSMGFIHQFLLNQHKRNVHGLDIPMRVVRVAKFKKETLNSTVVNEPLLSKSE